MSESTHRLTLGPYVLTRELEASVMAQRFLALHETDQSSHVAYRLGVLSRRADQRRFLAAVESLSGLDEPHILKIEQFALDQTDAAWVVTPFTGDADGVRTLDRLLRDKGGQLNAFEVEPAVTQVLQGVRHAHANARCNGPLALSDLLVDRHGRIVIELYGFRRALQGQSAMNAEVARDEIRSVAEIGYQLLTGLRAEEPIIPAGRLIKRLDPAWDDWFERAFDPTAGFDTADEALAALPSSVTVPPRSRPIRAVRNVLELIRPGRAD
jgi:hypothetical protein